MLFAFALEMERERNNKMVIVQAVANLAKVGREMVSTTDDSLLRQDMPIAINKVGFYY